MNRNAQKSSSEQESEKNVRKELAFLVHCNNNRAWVKTAVTFIKCSVTCLKAAGGILNCLHVGLQTETDFQVSKFLSLLEEEGGLDMREFCRSSD